MRVTAHKRESAREGEKNKNKVKKKRKEKKKKRRRRNIKLRSACWSALNYTTMSMHMKNGKTT